MGKSGLKINFTFVPMPLEAFDAGDPLREAGLRLLAYILKHTRFGEAFPEVTYEELLNGLLDDKGRRRDSGCGLSRNGIKNGQTELEERGWLEANNLSTDKSRPRWKYRLVLGDREVSPSDNAVSRKDSGSKVEVVSRTDNALSPSDSGTVTSCEVLSPSDTCNKEEESTKNLDKELERTKAEITAAPISRSAEQRQKQANLDAWDLRRWQEAMREIEGSAELRVGRHQEDADAEWRSSARRAAFVAGLTPGRIVELLKQHFPNDRNIDLLYPQHPQLFTEQPKPVESEDDIRQTIEHSLPKTGSSNFL